MRISAYCMVYNSVKWIKQMLDNIYPVFAEIVIVEGKSTDGTLEIIENYHDPKGKIKLFIIPQKGDRYDLKAWNQSYRRNFAIKQCTGDWIFMIDADETMEQGLIDMLPRLVNQGRCIAYRFSMKNLWRNKDQYRVDTRWWPCWRFRFWRNMPEWKYEDKPKHCKLRFEGRLVTDLKETSYKDIISASVLHWHYTDPENFRPDGTMQNSDNEYLDKSTVEVRPMHPAIQKEQKKEKEKPKYKFVFMAENAQPTTYYGGRTYNRYMIEALNDLSKKSLIYYTNNLPRFFDGIKSDLKVGRVDNAHFSGLPQVISGETFIGAPLYGGSRAIEMAGNQGRKAYAIIYDTLPLVQEYNIEADARFFSQPRWREYFNLLKRDYVKVIVISEYQREMTARWLNKPLNDVVVLEPCVDERTFDFKKRYERKNWITCITRMHERKNIEGVFKIWEMFNNYRYELHLIVSPASFEGIVSLHKKYRRLVNVVWHVNIDNELKFQLLSQSKLLINPSLFEGFGIWFIEALACRIPIVCFDYLVYKAIDEDQSSVFYAKYNDNVDFVRKIREALKSDVKPVLKNHWYKNFKNRIGEIFEGELS